MAEPVKKKNGSGVMPVLKQLAIAAAGAVFGAFVTAVIALGQIGALETEIKGLDESIEELKSAQYTKELAKAEFRRVDERVSRIDKHVQDVSERLEHHIEVDK